MIQPDWIYLEQTCMACPEQYDAYLGIHEIGYIRLRSGRLRVDGPDGETVLEHPFDDALKGEFDNEEERQEWLTKARKAIAEAYNKPRK